MNLQDLTPDSVLRRGDLAEALTACGYATSAMTLANWAVQGRGPPFRKYGKTPIYRWGDALAWAEARAGEPRTMTERRKPRTAEELVRRQEEKEQRTAAADEGLKELGL